ncbi:hypothetical protein V491_03865 [Pseudogymnoascus sp. VKM F-3775]|nr:hypothetical protein V491_03865 [Pseudogymnoascus sp. VKM F-3775]
MPGRRFSTVPSSTPPKPRAWANHTNFTMANHEKQNNNYATDEVQTKTDEEPEEEPQQQEQPVATQSKGQRTMQHRQNRRQNELLAPLNRRRSRTGCEWWRACGSTAVEHYGIHQKRIGVSRTTDDAYDRPATDWEYGRHRRSIRQSRIKDRPR